MMSDATLDQHSKPQASERMQNGLEKDLVQEDFSTSYLHPASQQQGYGLPASDHYIPNYYGQMAFPYMGEWSTAGESVPYLSGYNNIGNGEPPHHSFMHDAMFSQPAGGIGNGQAYFNAPVFQPGNEFTAWSSPPTGHNSGLESGLGHQSATNSYNNDFYQTIMPTMPQDYLGRNDIIGNQSNIGSMMGHSAQSGIMPGGMPGGDGMNKMTGSPPVKVIEHGMHALNMGGDSETLAAKATVSHGGINPSISQVDNIGVSNNYGSAQVAQKVSPTNSTPQVPAVAKPISWAAIASKPAKPQPKPKLKPTVGPGLPPPIKHNMDIGNWDTGKVPTRADYQMGSGAGQWNNARASGSNPYENGTATLKLVESSSNKDDYEEKNNSVVTGTSNPVLDKLKLQNDYNPKRLTIDLRNSRFFVIKSYSEDDIHRSIKYNIWCSTEHGNKRLDATFRAQKNRGPVILLYSVNGSGHFCGVAEMKTAVDYSSRAGVWSQDKWKGKFQVKWIYVKDVPNTVLRHIRLENNDNKPVTNSRDTQEVPAEKGRQVLKIIANYKHQTSIFDDFGHYERRQQEEENQRNRAAMSRDRKQGEESHLASAIRKSTLQD